MPRSEKRITDNIYSSAVGRKTITLREESIHNLLKGCSPTSCSRCRGVRIGWQIRCIALPYLTNYPFKGRRVYRTTKLLKGCSTTSSSLCRGVRRGWRSRGWEWGGWRSSPWPAGHPRHHPSYSWGTGPPRNTVSRDGDCWSMRRVIIPGGPRPIRLFRVQNVLPWWGKCARG